MKLIVLPNAKNNIERLFNFLLEKNPEAAERAMQAIDDALDQLSDFPESGLPMNDETKRRQWFIPFAQRAYVIRYRIEDETIIVIGLEDRIS